MRSREEGEGVMTQFHDFQLSTHPPTGSSRCPAIGLHPSNESNSGSAAAHEQSFEFSSQDM